MEQVSTGRRILRPSDDPVAWRRHMALRGVPVEEREHAVRGQPGATPTTPSLVDSKSTRRPASSPMCAPGRRVRQRRLFVPRTGRHRRRHHPAVRRAAPSPTARTPPATSCSAAIAATPCPSAAAWRPASSTRAIRARARCRSRPPATCRSPAPARRSSTPSAPARVRLALGAAANSGSALVSGLSLSGYNDHNYVVEVGHRPELSGVRHHHRPQPDRADHPDRHRQRQRHRPWPSAASA